MLVTETAFPRWILIPRFFNNLEGAGVEVDERGSAALGGDVPHRAQPAYAVAEEKIKDSW